MAEKEKNETIETEEAKKDVSEPLENEEEKDDMAELEKKLNDANEKYMRTLAEYDNYRKRTIKEKESIYPEAKAVVVEKFLGVMDNLDRAISAAENKDSFYDGVVAIKKQLDEVFSGLGVCEIEAVGQSFNPEMHNAVMHVEDENFGENTVCEEFQKGYRIGDRVVRHSMVKVAN